MNQIQDKECSTNTEHAMYAEDNYDHASPGLIYIDTCCPGVGVDEEIYYSGPKGCDCTGTCDQPSCSCRVRSGNTSADAAPKWNQIEPIFECNSDCGCVALCGNKMTQSGPRKGLKVVPIKEKGFGVVTEGEIPEGVFVCLYAGEVIGEEDATRRMQALRPTDANYILVLREHIGHTTNQAKVQTTIIDPTYLGNIGRYLNHSCDPNLCVVPIRSDSFVPMAAMFTTRLIQSGQELSYSYDSTTRSEETMPLTIDHLSSKPCRCSSLKCKGFLPCHPCFS